MPKGAALIACGNRETDRGVVHRMPTPLASRFVHLEIRVDAEDWCAWGAANGIAAEVLFFIQLEPTLLHHFDPQSKEKAFPCPKTWHFTSNIVHHRNGLDPGTRRSYHADLSCGNTECRIHYLLEPGWRADQAIQGLGRTYRTHQASAPLFRPVATDVKGERRFIATIARTLPATC